MRRLFVAVALTANAAAAEFESLQVRHEGGDYTVEASARIDAGIDAVRAVITDYRHMHWITGAVQEAAVLDRPEAGVAIVYVRSRACFGFLCRTIEQVQQADARDRDRVVFVTFAHETFDDLEHARSEWRLEALDEGRTRIFWTLEMDPAFWVPPLIGPGLIRDSLEDEGRDMIRGIEKLAREREARP